MSLPKAWNKTASVGLCFFLEGGLNQSFTPVASAIWGGNLSLQKKNKKNTAVLWCRADFFFFLLSSVLRETISFCHLPCKMFCPSRSFTEALFWRLNPESVPIITSHALQDWLCDMQRVHIKKKKAVVCTDFGCSTHTHGSAVCCGRPEPMQCSAVCAGAVQPAVMLLLLLLLQRCGPYAGL